VPIISSLLDHIEDLMMTSANDKEQRMDVSIDFNKNFYAWDAQQNEFASFSNLSRDEKFERLFLTMILLIRILEHDFSIFAIKYSSKSSYIQSSSNKHKPLICYVIWNSFESVTTINATIKKLISIYVNMNGLNYPASKIRVISRLLSLVAQVINMSEYPDSSVMEYPIFKNYSIDLANEIQKSVENSVFYNIDLYLKVTERIRSPLIRMILTNNLHSKICGEKVQTPSSMSVVFNTMQNKDFEKFHEEAARIQNGNAEESIYVRYSVYEKRNVKRCKVSKCEYLKLMLIYAESVNSFYQIKAGFENYKKQRNRTSLSTQSQIYVDIESESDEKVALKSVNLNFKNAVHINLTKDTCKFYRNEIKFYLLLEKMIHKNPENFGSLHAAWKKLFKL
jgi:hypothetical protein